MPTKLTPDVAELLRSRFSQLINYEADDPLEPIEPETYVDSNGDSLLHIAVLINDFESVEMMISAGFDLNVLGDLNNTPLHYAYQIGDSAMIESLKKAGARSDIRNILGALPAQAGKRVE